MSKIEWVLSQNTYVSIKKRHRLNLKTLLLIYLRVFCDEKKRLQNVVFFYFNPDNINDAPCLMSHLLLLILLSVFLSNAYGNANLEFTEHVCLFFF